VTYDGKKTVFSQGVRLPKAVQWSQEEKPSMSRKAKDTDLTRRDFVKTVGLTGLAVAGVGMTGAMFAPEALAVFTQEAQAAVTPAKALEMLKQGNERFVSNKLRKRDLMAQVKKTGKGQFPFAAIVSCLDSRTQPEYVFDQGIGDIFVARVAGNFVDDDILGSLEFATKLAAGARLIVIFGHTECGAVRRASDKAQLGLLTATLASINPAVEAVRGDYNPRNSENDKFVQAVAEKNVELTMQKLRTRSVVLLELIDKGEVGLVGAMYNVRTGKVIFH
jgi:carbonic anhydrase